MTEIFNLSIIFTLGVILSIVIFGLLIGQIERVTNGCIYRRFKDKGIIFTGIIGTTVHEFGHYIMCILFRHKIIDVKWFSTRVGISGELGHVRHYYEERSIYQRIGNFFIGVAPVIVGTLMLIISFKLLLPNSFNEIIKNTNFNTYLNMADNFSLKVFLSTLLDSLLLILKELFIYKNFLNIRFYIFILIALSISTHMSLSRADLINSFDGIVFIYGLSLLLSFILIIFGIPYVSLMHGILKFNIILISFLSIGLLFSIIALIISKILTLNA
ncbi:hypothetical protein GCM10008916_14430 [Clostridium nitritogenes]|uniref:Integral membrane protein n=1 Tax=Clostridium nitritogenes TaxID=83340 RepID=A0ABP3WZC5_9CLOT